MASPQTENGYTKIANEIMDALCRCNPGGSEGQVLWAILRKTYGWNKTCDKISYSQLSEATGLARRTVIYAIHNLEAKKMIVVQRVKTNTLNEINVISFQKNHEDWVVQEIDGSARKCQAYKATIDKQKERYKRGVVQEVGGSARKRKRVVQENVKGVQFLAPTKDIITKDIITKDILYPDWIPVKTFLEYQLTRKKKLKLGSYDRFFRHLKKLSDKSGATPEEILNQSIVNGWEGIFELKAGGGNGKDAHANQGSGGRYAPRYGQRQPADIPEDALRDIAEANRLFAAQTSGRSTKNAG